MLKRLVITLAIVGFSMNVFAGGGSGGKPAAKPRVESQEDRENKEKGNKGSTSEGQQHGTSADVKDQAKSSQKINLERSVLAEIKNGDLKKKIDALISDTSSTEDNGFLKSVVAKLLNSAKADNSNRENIEQFINESFELMKLDVKSGGAMARKALQVFSDRLDRGLSIERAADEAVEEAFRDQGYSVDQIAEKKRQFKQACLGLKA